MAINEAVLLGRSMTYLDYEDTPQTFKRRSLLLGFDPLNHLDAFKYVTPGLVQRPEAIEEAKLWL